MSFDTTRWTIIAAARDSDPEVARAALSALCEAYWYPLYAFIRRWGADRDTARDLTQAFFTSLLERRDFERVTPERGRFRTFLLASAKHFLLNEAARARAAKRGGAVSPIPLPFDEGEGRYRFEPADHVTPETLYERRWALTLLDRVIAVVQAKWESTGRGAEFSALKVTLLGERPPGGYAGAAQQLGSSEGAVRVAVHRLRKTFRAELRAAIAETVSDPSDIDEELKYLERALGA